jgi:hypothetical protein
MTGIVLLQHKKAVQQFTTRVFDANAARINYKIPDPELTDTGK